MMGRWSEFRVVFGCQFALMPRCEFVIVRSGEEVGPFRGVLVVVSWLIIISEVLSSALTISVLRVAAVSSRVVGQMTERLINDRTDKWPRDMRQKGHMTERQMTQRTYSGKTNDRKTNSRQTQDRADV